MDRYTALSFERYRRTLCTALAPLREPAAEPDRALRRLALLIESLVGYAIGAALGRVATGIRHGFDAHVRRAVAGELAVAGRAVAPPPRVPPAGAFLADADQRPLLDLLGATLHARLCIAEPTARALVQHVHDTVARASPPRVPQLEQTLELLAADDAGALAFGDQLTTGWSHLCASLGVGVAELPDLAALQRTRASWRAWTERLVDKPVLEPTHEQVVAAGYVMRVG